jgi:replicative DNA helicase
MNPTLELLDRMPPHDTSAERAVLGSVLIDPQRLTDVAAILTERDFYLDAHRLVWRGLAALDDAGKPIDLLLLSRHLRDAGSLEAAGGNAGLAEIVRSVAVSAHAEHYAGIVRQHARYRALIGAATEALRASYARDDTPEAIADAMEAAILEADPGSGAPVEASDAAVKAMASFAADTESRRMGAMTGLAEFDERIGGLFRGELCILAARPGIGKTSLACQIAHRAASRGKRVYFVSLEMSAVELVTRVICSQANVSSKLVRTGQLQHSHVAALSQAAQPFAGLKWSIHDKPSMTVAEIRRWGRRLAKKDLGLIVIDYLQLLTPADRRIQRHEQVGQLSKALKELARELDVPVLCLTQLSREAVKDQEPQLHHLRESGSIEQDADMVLFLYPPTEREKERADEAGAPGDWNAVLKVAKNRNGELAKLRLLWEPERTRFTGPMVQPFGGL